MPSFTQESGSTLDVVAVGDNRIGTEDCIGLCGLTEDEIAAVAEHEHLSTMLALGMGSYLRRTATGQAQIETMINDDFAAATQRGDLAHATRLAGVLVQFRQRHADCGDGDNPAHH